MLAELAASIERNTDDAHGCNSTRSVRTTRNINAYLNLMGWDPVSVDTLIKRSGLTTGEVSSMLLLLELDGRVDSLAGGRYVQREEGRSQ